MNSLLNLTMLRRLIRRGFACQGAEQKKLRSYIWPNLKNDVACFFPCGREYAVGIATGGLITMRPSPKFFLAALIVTAIGCGMSGAKPFADPRFVRQRIVSGGDPACETASLVSTGGAFPKDSQTLAIRWTGYTNFELVYNGQIILLDAHFDRGSMFPPLGFTAADVKRANVILLGHGHLDHMSDAASVGARTGAVVVGAAVTTDKLKTQSIDAKQIRTVTGRGGELLEFPGFKVEPILGRHGEPPKNVTEAFDNALKATSPAPTKEQIAERNKIRERGTNDSRVVTEGTIAFLITLDNGFRIMFRDSGGVITDYEKAAMQRTGRVDVALVAVSAAYLHTLTAQRALEHMRAYKPDVYIPGHHDAPFNGLWRATEPLFQALKDENPNIITVSRGYREPICFDTEYNIQRKQGG
jgi:L-ascorbate metabolism protein UlaG (beta-lactamase superfamily)